MKLQTKFLSFGAISVFCVLILAINSYSIFNGITALSLKIGAMRSINIKQDDRNLINSKIRTAIWNSMYMHATGDKDQIAIIKNELNNDIDYYRSQLLKTGMPITIKFSIFPKVSIDNNSTEFTTINQNISIADKFINDLIISAYALIENIDSPEMKDNLAKAKKMAEESDKMNDLIGNEVDALIEKTKEEGTNVIKESIQNTFIIAMFSIILVCLVPLLSSYSLFNPLATLIASMNMIVNNDKDKEVPFTSRTDEIGNIAKALEIFRLNAVEKDQLENQAKEQVHKSAEERRKSLLVFANSFETTVKAIVDTVATASTKMNITARELEQLSNHAQQETNQLSSTSVQTNTNIQGVSKATAEFNSAVNEISTQVTNSLEYARRAAEQTDKVGSVVLDLETKAKAISSIIDIINNITSQIDLLALNATIEAARAGDMGKGFAVVANEVKALATQTSKATEQINIQISGIQSSTNKAVVAIHEITESVKTINQNSASIASAVEEQSVSTSYIAESISQVALMSNSVSVGVEKVAESSVHSGTAASQMVSAAEDLLKQSSMLQNEVDKFLFSLKST